MDEFLNEGSILYLRQIEVVLLVVLFVCEGISTLHKIKTFSMERIIAEFDYVAKIL